MAMAHAKIHYKKKPAVPAGKSSSLLRYHYQKVMKQPSKFCTEYSADFNIKKIFQIFSFTANTRYKKTAPECGKRKMLEILLIRVDCTTISVC